MSEGRRGLQTAAQSQGRGWEPSASPTWAEVSRLRMVGLDSLMPTAWGQGAPSSPREGVGRRWHGGKQLQIGQL